MNCNPSEDWRDMSIVSSMVTNEDIWRRGRTGMTILSAIGVIRIYKIGKPWLDCLALILSFGWERCPDDGRPPSCLWELFVWTWQNDHLKSVVYYRFFGKTSWIKSCRVMDLDFYGVPGLLLSSLTQEATCPIWMVPRKPKAWQIIALKKFGPEKFTLP